VKSLKGSGAAASRARRRVRAILRFSFLAQDDLFGSLGGGQGIITRLCLVVWEPCQRAHQAGTVAVTWLLVVRGLAWLVPVGYLSLSSWR
jgi:hypothetical protein